MSKKTKTASSESLKQMGILLKPYRFHIGLAVFLALLPAYITVWMPFLVGRLVDEALLGRDLSMLLMFGGFLVALRVLLFMFQSLITYSLSAFGLQILVDYRSQLLERILHYPISFFDKVSSGKLTTRLTSDINSLQEFFSSALVPLIGNAFLMLGVMVAMLVINWKLALISFAIVPAIVILSIFFNDRIRRRFGIMRQSLSQLNSFAGESFAGIRDLQVFDAVESNQQEFDRLSKKYQLRFLQAVREYAIFNPLVPMITAFMDILILAFGSYFVLQGKMSVGSVVAFLGYAAHFSYPIREFSEKFTVLQQALAAVDRLMEVTNHERELDQGKLIWSGRADIEFKNVSFAYGERLSAAVRDLDFKVKAGEKIALLGETGSGKSTTTSLLMRFYEPTSGEILLAGKALQEYSLDSFRSQMGWVSQDVILFSKTLRENLQLGSLKASDQDLWKALEWVQLKDWAENLPEGLDTELSERGASFSSGQRQLLSLARALIRKPKILILDEATAYIDSPTEWMLQQAIEKIFSSSDFEGTTAFIIAHRLSTLKKCDRMLVFKNGRLMEQGIYSDLVKSKGYARDLFHEHYRSV